jgi:hypothetical protein
MLHDRVKPQIAIYSDDVISGHKPLALLEDPQQLELDQFLTAKEAPISDELLSPPHERK